MLLTVQERIDQLRCEIDQLRSGRPVTLIAVSKTKPLSLLLEAHQAGQRHFGENRVQEAQEKQPSMPEGSVFHLIGPLQKNKVKTCPALFQWIHSLDRLDIAQKVNQKYDEADREVNLLVQVNLTGEASKSGLKKPDELKGFCEALMPLKRIKLRGLMTLGHPNWGEQQNRNLFASLRKLQESIALELGISDQMNQLSMGMSHDWRWAIAEGATLLRIGSSIFGSRAEL